MSIRTYRKIQRRAATFAEYGRRAQSAAVLTAGCGCGAGMHFLTHPCIEHGLMALAAWGTGAWFALRAGLFKV